MIRFIAAIDSAYGIADDKGIPWLGLLPTDMRQYREKIRGFPIIMGYGHYVELTKPYPESLNYVATKGTDKLLPGFIAVTDAHAFFEAFEGDIWNIGGAQLYETTLDLADELYLTRVNGDYGCTKFFPHFESNFVRKVKSPIQEENGIMFSFEKWIRK